MGKPRIPFLFLESLLGILCAIDPPAAYPEGTCSWEEARAILEQSPELLTHVEQTLSVDPTGFALRLGSHYTDLSGQRVAPYTFRAVSKTSPDLALELVVEAEMAFFDHAGKAVTAAESERAHQVRQTLTGIRLRPAPPAVAPAADAAAMNHRTAWIREQDAALLATELPGTVIPFPPNGPFSGEARFFRDPAAKAIRKIVIRAAPAPAGAAGFGEEYDFAAGELILLRRQENTWIPHPENPGQSIHRVVETSYFFQDGAIYQALEKRYEATDKALLEREAQAAGEQRVPLTGAESMQFLSRASRLSLVTSPAGLLEVYAPAP